MPRTHRLVRASLATFIAIRGIIIICPLVGAIRGSCIEQIFLDNSSKADRIIARPDTYHFASLSVNEFWSKTGEFLTTLMSWPLLFYASYNFTDCSIAFWNGLECNELIMVRDKCWKNVENRQKPERTASTVTRHFKNPSPFWETERCYVRDSAAITVGPSRKEFFHFFRGFLFFYEIQMWFAGILLFRSMNFTGKHLEIPDKVSSAKKSARRCP